MIRTSYGEKRQRFLGGSRKCQPTVDEGKEGLSIKAAKRDRPKNQGSRHCIGRGRATEELRTTHSKDESRASKDPVEIVSQAQPSRRTRSLGVCRPTLEPTGISSYSSRQQGMNNTSEQNPHKPDMVLSGPRRIRQYETAVLSEFRRTLLDWANL